MIRMHVKVVARSKNTGGTETIPREGRLGDFSGGLKSMHMCTFIQFKENFRGLTCFPDCSTPRLAFDVCSSSLC